MTINELIEKAHSAAKDKGFWDQERNTGELLMLIVSECGEALEAHRKGRRANLRAFDTSMEPCMWKLVDGEMVKRESMPEKALAGCFSDYVKGSFEDELADIVIRIADLCGGRGWALPSTIPAGPEPVDEHNVGDMLLMVVNRVCTVRQSDSPYFLPNALSAVFRLAELEGIDLWRHIELKLAYNATRPRLHGKAY